MSKRKPDNNSEEQYHTMLASIGEDTNKKQKRVKFQEHKEVDKEEDIRGDQEINLSNLLNEADGLNAQKVQKQYLSIKKSNLAMGEQLPAIEKQRI
jgi:hypothetical protein